jgi:hypothetical protein
LSETITELEEAGTTLHLCDVKGPVRDVLHRSGLWDRLDGRIHATAHMAVQSIRGTVSPPPSMRVAGIDERHGEPNTPAERTGSTTTASTNVASAHDASAPADIRSRPAKRVADTPLVHTP